jgi:hypothetical protein
MQTATDLRLRRHGHRNRRISKSWNGLYRNEYSKQIRPPRTKPTFAIISLMCTSHILATRPALQIFYQTSWFFSCVE